MSIPAFPTVELPRLTVIVGLNGSGKSQMLQAIVNGHVAADIFRNFENDAVNPSEGVLLLEHGVTPPLKFEPVTSSLTEAPGMHMPRADVMEFEPSHNSITSGPWQTIQALSADRTHLLMHPRSEMWRAGADDLIHRLGLEGANADVARSAFEQAEAAFAGEIIRAGPMHSATKSAIQRAARILNKPALQVSIQDIRNMGGWGEYSSFTPAITKLFAGYRDAQVENSIKRHVVEEGGDGSFLDREQFKAEFGEPPWELLNKVLLDFGLNYEVIAPSRDPRVQVHFGLKRLDNQATIGAEQLSSGERVLLRFALSLFQSDPYRTKVSKPELLLLDEMDASLHPEMLSRWLRAITEGLVEREGMACILTTHSPTTVALAPEDSLHELEFGTGVLRKVTRQQALNRLTFGVPTLSIDFSGRRQVFVESDTDAAIYENLSAILKGKLDFPFSLSFLSTGVRTKGEEVGTGCAAVRSVVSKLREAGNRSIFGLIDWDGKNHPDDRVFVIGQGSHYALDNVLLHPVLVGALLLRDSGSVFGYAGGFASLSTASEADLQSLADAVMAGISYPSDDTSSSPDILLSGAAITVRAIHKTMNGHALEQLLFQSHKSLQRYNGGRGKLTRAIVDRVLIDYPALCPVVLADLLKLIAESEVS